MSGGHYDYVYSFIEMFANAIQTDIDRNDKPDDYGYAPDLKPPTLAKVQLVQRFMTIAAKIAKDLEWFYSGDTGEETLNEQLLAHIINISNLFPGEPHEKKKKINKARTSHRGHSSIRSNHSRRKRRS